MNAIQSCTRSLLRLSLRSLPPHQRGIIDRIRTSLALEHTPIHTFVPKSSVEAVIGTLLTHSSPSQFVADVATAVQAASGLSGYGKIQTDSQSKADAVKQLLALAVVCS